MSQIDVAHHEPLFLSYKSTSPNNFGTEAQPILLLRMHQKKENICSLQWPFYMETTYFLLSAPPNVLEQISFVEQTVSCDRFNGRISIQGASWSTWARNIPIIIHDWQLGPAVITNSPIGFPSPGRRKVLHYMGYTCPENVFVLGIPTRESLFSPLTSNKARVCVCWGSTRKTQTFPSRCFFPSLPGNHPAASHYWSLCLFPWNLWQLGNFFLELGWRNMDPQSYSCSETLSPENRQTRLFGAKSCSSEEWVICFYHHLK